MGLVQTTIVPPRAAHEYVLRETIESLSGQVGKSRVVTVIGPAGFGKTTAMQRWAQLLGEQRRRVMWIAARAGIESLESFIQALGEAGAAAGIDAGDANPRSWLVEFANRSGPRPVLFVDDSQLLPADVHKFLEQLIFSARDELTTVIASRGEVPINVARLRSLGHLLEIGVRHLHFSSSEAARLIGQEVGGADPRAAGPEDHRRHSGLGCRADPRGEGLGEGPPRWHHASRRCDPVAARVRQLLS